MLILFCIDVMISFISSPSPQSDFQLETVPINFISIVSLHATSFVLYAKPFQNKFEGAEDILVLIRISDWKLSQSVRL